MTLRPRKSLSRLTTWFNNHTRQTLATTELIWIFLRPGKHFTSGGDLYFSSLERLNNALSTETGVQSVVRIASTSPSALPSALTSNFTSLSSTSTKAWSDSILVEVEHAALRPVIDKLRTLLTVGDIATEPSSGRQLLRWSVSTYTLTQRFEPRVSRGMTGACIVTVAMDPAPGQESDLDTWYRRDVLPALGAKSPGLFLRCRRYERLLDPTSVGQLEGIVAARRFLAVQEFASVEKLLRHSIEKGRLVEETELGKKVLDSARSVERVVWKLDDRVGSE